MAAGIYYNVRKFNFSIKHSDIGLNQCLFSHNTNLDFSKCCTVYWKVFHNVVKYDTTRCYLFLHHTSIQSHLAHAFTSVTCPSLTDSSLSWNDYFKYTYAKRSSLPFSIVVTYPQRSLFGFSVRIVVGDRDQWKSLCVGEL